MLAYQYVPKSEMTVLNNSLNLSHKKMQVVQNTTKKTVRTELSKEG